MRQDGSARPGRPELTDQRMLDADTVGNVDEGAAGEERCVQGGELIAIGFNGAEEIALDQIAMLASGLRQRHEDHPLPRERWVERRRGGRCTALPERAADLLQRPGRRRPVGLLIGGVAVQIETLEVGLAPVLLPLRVRQAHALVDAEGLEPPRAQPLRFAVKSAQLFDGRFRERHFYPTEPIISSWIRRFSSTAYSMGSSLVNGSMKPLTIIVSASALVIPRLCR